MRCRKRERILRKITISYSNASPSLSFLFDMAEFFGMSEGDAKRRFYEMAKTALQWRSYAEKRGAPRKEVE